MGILNEDLTPAGKAREARRQARMTEHGATDLPRYTAEAIYGTGHLEWWSDPVGPFDSFEVAVTAGHSLAAKYAADGNWVSGFRIFQPTYSPADRTHESEVIAIYDYSPDYGVDEARTLGLV